MALRIVSFDAAAPAFDACFSIRLKVFVEEQGVALSEERDEYDAGAIHFLATFDDQPAGTARVILKPDASAKITRVAVLNSFRGRGIGAALMRDIEAAPAFKAISRFSLDAQVHALAFYERLGYTATGPEFLEAGIAHRHMEKCRD